MESTTPTTEVSWDQCQKSTLVNARIQGAIDFLMSEGITGKNEAVFGANGVSHTTGYRILRSSNPRTLKNGPTRKETRRGHNKITPEQIREMEKMLENEGLEGRSLTWMQLGFEAQIEASEATVRRAMGTLQCHKSLACQRGWQSPSSKKNREQFAESMLARYPNPEDWDRVRFSNEVHFGWGPQHHLRIIRKPGQLYCVDCIQHSDMPKSKYEKRFHYWAAVGYDFKSDLTFYEVPGNTNGKISLQVYITQNLEPAVKPWLIREARFCVGRGW